MGKERLDGSGVRLINGIWLHEDSMLDMFLETGKTFAGKGTYQFRKFQSAFPFIDKFRHAIDVGAHVGTWSRVFARCFAKVTAFEPNDAAADCFDMNVIDNQCDIKLHRVALGHKHAMVGLTRDDVLTRVKRGDEVAMCMLDDFNFQEVDLIKIDVEGFEERVLRGAEATIRNNKPLLIIEQKPGLAEKYQIENKAAIILAHSWGARVRWELDGDYCMTWLKR